MEEFPFIERVPDEQRDSFKIDGISKLHHLRVKENGIADEVSCLNCAPSAICEECNGKDIYCTQGEDSDDDVDDQDVSYDDDEDIDQSKEIETDEEGSKILN